MDTPPISNSTPKTMDLLAVIAHGRGRGVGGAAGDRAGGVGRGERARQVTRALEDGGVGGLNRVGVGRADGPRKPTNPLRPVAPRREDVLLRQDVGFVEG